MPINGLKVRAYRKKRGWTQDDLAEHARISRSYLAEIERGTKRPRLLVTEALATALGVTISDIANSKRPSKF